mgnify:CR=1 FL=1
MHKIKWIASFIMVAATSKLRGNLIFLICSIDKNSHNARNLDSLFKKTSNILAMETQKNTALAFGAKNLSNELDKVLKDKYYQR